MLGDATKQRTAAKETTIGDKTCRDTVLKWGKLREQKNPDPFTPPFKVRFTMFPTGSSNGLPVARICISPFEVAKRQKGPVGQIASVNFVVNCSCSRIIRKGFETFIV